jgi:signal transduction histidine kinase
MDMTELTASLSQLVLERVPDGRFVRRGEVPSWCGAVHGDELREEQPFDAEAVFPFLATFMPRAEQAWRSARPTCVDSEFWTEVGSNGEELHLEATAVRAGSSDVLVVRRNEALFVQQQLVLQRARELRMTHDALTREMEQKDILMHAIVHDLAAPLHSVLGALSLLDEQRLGAPNDQWIKLALSAATRQRQLIAEILDVFSAEREEEAPHLTSTGDAPDLVRIAEQVIAESGAVARRRDVRLELRAPASCRVIADESRLVRVLTNLVDNALRYSPARGTITIAIGRDGGVVRVAVCDDGPGVSRELLPVLFAKFAKGQGGRAGTGLGLYFCRITVEKWGGGIGYEARAPHGATFWFRLMVAESTRAASAHAGDREHPHG